RSPRDSPWEPDVETTPYRYCGVCGQPLEPGATVCANCGASVEGATGAGAAGAVGAAGADDTGVGPATGDSTMAMPAAAAAGAAGGGAAGHAAGGGRAGCGRRGQ